MLLADRSSHTGLTHWAAHPQSLGIDQPDWTKEPKATPWSEPPPPYDWRNPPPYKGAEGSPELPMDGLYGSLGKGKKFGSPPEKLHWREVQRQPVSRLEGHQGEYMMAVASFEVLRGCEDFGKRGVAWNKPVPVRFHSLPFHRLLQEASCECLP